MSANEKFHLLAQWDWSFDSRGLLSDIFSSGAVEYVSIFNHDEHLPARQATRISWTRICLLDNIFRLEKWLCLCV